MPLEITYSADLDIIGRNEANDFTVSIAGELIPTSGSSTAETVDDASYDQIVSASTFLGARVSVTPTTEGYVVSTDTPSVCAVDGDLVTPLQTGSAGVVVTTDIGVRRYDKAVSILPGVATKTTTGYSAGSLMAHVHSAIQSMVAGKTAGAGTKEIYSAANYDIGSPSATRNASLFSGALDLSAISFMRSDISAPWQPFNFPVDLIAPQAIGFAWHVRPATGTQIVFMRPNGTFQTVTTETPLRIGSSQYDLGIAKLSAPVTGITPMATLPSGWEDKLPTLSGGYVSAPGVQMPVLFKGARSGDWSYQNRLDVLPCHSLSGFSYYNTNTFNGAFLSEFQPWSDNVVGGDSGGPAFIPVSGEAAVLSFQHTPGAGSSIPEFRTLIDAGLTTLMGTSTSMRTVSLEQFTTY